MIMETKCVLLTHINPVVLQPFSAGFLEVTLLCTLIKSLLYLWRNQQASLCVQDVRSDILTCIVTRTANGEYHNWRGKRLPWITSSGLWGDHSPDCLDRLREEEGRNRSLLANPPGLRPLLANVQSQGRWIRDLSPPQHPRSSCRTLQADRVQTSRAQDYSWTRGGGLCVCIIDAWCSAWKSL